MIDHVSSPQRTCLPICWYLQPSTQSNPYRRMSRSVGKVPGLGLPPGPCTSLHSSSGQSLSLLCRVSGRLRGDSRHRSAPQEMLSIRRGLQSSQGLAPLNGPYLWKCCTQIVHKLYTSISATGRLRLSGYTCSWVHTLMGKLMPQRDHELTSEPGRLSWLEAGQTFRQEDSIRLGPFWLL